MVGEALMVRVHFADGIGEPDLPRAVAEQHEEVVHTAAVLVQKHSRAAAVVVVTLRERPQARRQVALWLKRLPAVDRAGASIAELRDEATEVSRQDHAGGVER